MITGRSDKILVFNDMCKDIDLLKKEVLEEYSKHKYSLPEYHTGYRMKTDSDAPFSKKMDEDLRPLLLEYINEFSLNSDIKYDFSEWIVMGWTIPGRGMELHNDHITDTSVLEEMRQQPWLTSIFYLSHDCEGGQLHFPDVNFTLAPETGTLIIFPSEMNHEVLSYISGERIVIQKFIFERKGLSK